VILICYDGSTDARTVDRSTTIADAILGDRRARCDGDPHGLAWVIQHADRTVIVVPSQAAARARERPTEG
jgi:hypothetical protein